MKTINYLFALLLMISSFSTFAQETIINPETSTISWLGKKIGGQHEGVIKIKKGSLELKNGKIIAGDFTIDMNSITCTDLESEGYSEKLVGHLKSDDFFGVEKFPEAMLKITSAKEFSNNKASVTGELTIKGKTEIIVFDLTKSNNNYITKINVDRSKFNVKYGSDSFFDNLGDKAIEDIFVLNVKLVVN